MANVTKVTVQKKGRFIAAVRNTGNITQAAATIGLSRRHLYRVRDADPEFAAAWQEAVAEYVDALEAEADRRAVEGVPKPIMYKGEVVAEIRQYSDVLLMFRLKALRPEIYRERATVEHTCPCGGPFQVQLIHYADL